MEGYKNENSVDIHVEDLIFLKDNGSKTKLNKVWISPFEVIELVREKNIVIQKEEM